MRTIASRDGPLWIGLVLAACGCVAAANVATKALLETAPVLPVVFVQLLASTTAVWIVALATGRFPRVPRDMKLAVPGLLQPGLAYVLTFRGLALTSVAVEGVLFACETALVAVLAWPLLGERPAPAIGVSVAIGTVGVVLLTLPGAAVAPTSTAGVALILAGVCCAALDTVASRALMVEGDALAMTAAGHLAGLALVGLLLGGAAPTSWAFVADPRSLGLAAASGILLHGVATVMFNAALARTPAARVAALLPAISLFSVAGGAAVLGERLARAQVAGAALVIASALIAALRSSSPEPGRSSRRPASQPPSAKPPRAGSP